MNILQYLTAKFSPDNENVETHNLYSNISGVSLDGEQLFRWTDVVSIEAYKKDLVTEDLVCLDIKLKSEQVITVHEELLGFEEFKTMMYSTLTMDNHDWMASVAEHEFEEARIEIYKGHEGS